jgi:hypothetical protein
MLPAKDAERRDCIESFYDAGRSFADLWNRIDLIGSPCLDITWARTFLHGFTLWGI